jgi:hypothetical protein
MGATPQLPRDDLVKWMKGIESQISLLHERMNNPLANTGLTVPSAGVVECDGTFNVVGSQSVSGDLSISGTLELPNGSVNNAALVNPIVPNVVNQVATNFAIPASSWTTIVTNTVTVPAGFTQLLALATGMAFVVNPNTTGGSNGTGGDIVECRMGIGGTYGMGAGVSISGSNGQTSCPAAVAVLLTGLTPGGTVTLVTQATTGFQAFAANGSNQANLCAQLLWLR